MPTGSLSEWQKRRLRAIQAIPLVLGESHRKTAVYLDTCRKKRNTAEYESAGVISEHEAEELVAFTAKFQTEVIANQVSPCTVMRYTSLG
jgi:hypothetical protein